MRFNATSRLSIAVATLLNSAGVAVAGFKIFISAGNVLFEDKLTICVNES